MKVSILVGCMVLVVALASPTMAQEADTNIGERVFKKCRACHEIKKAKNKVGPHLVGIVGRKAGVVEGFKYSPALKKMAAEKDLFWDEANLDKYLEAPRKFIKRGRMAFAGLRDQEDRANLIAYLKSVHKAD